MDNLREVEPETGTVNNSGIDTGAPVCPTGAFVGPYRIQEELGRGFSSVVYLAADPKRGRAVALKLLTFPSGLPAELQADLTERFRREARAVAGLSHPHIVAVYDAGQSGGGQPYLVLERLRGQSLRQRLRAAGRLPAAEALPIALRVAEALDYAHGRGIVHRDIKPDNIFLCLPDPADAGGDSAALPKLMDFGISRTLSDQEMTQDGMVVGSPAYMAPEQISGEPVDARTDVFSLAVTLAEMLTGAKPFEADTVPAVMRQILHQPPQLAGLDDPRLERVLRKAMAKRAGQRFATAGEFAEALRRALPLPGLAPSVSTQFAPALPSDTPARPLWAGARRPVWGLWLGAVALLGTALGVGTMRLWPVPAARPALAAVRVTPPYPVQTAQTASQTASPPAPAVREPAPAVPKPAPAARKAVPPPAVLAALPYAPAAPARPAAHPIVRPALRPAPTPPVRRAARSLHLAPSPPVVVHLASAHQASVDQPRPVVRVRASQQEPVRQEPVRQEPARQDTPPQEAPPPALPPDGPPRLLTRTTPLLPPGVTGDGAQVTLHLHISKLGEVTDADLVQSSGNDDLDTAALDAAGGWTYTPALHNGRPVRGETDAVVTFPGP